MWFGNEGFLFQLDNSYFSFVIGRVLTFIFIFIGDYFWHELNVTRYNACCESLEQDSE